VVRDAERKASAGAVRPRTSAPAQRSHQTGAVTPALVAMPMAKAPASGTSGAVASAPYTRPALGIAE
jgi:hypothetical protein